MASDKQIQYALNLLYKAGYGDKWMSSKFKELGATMKERSGTIDAWLRSMSGAKISQLIDKLKGG